MTTHHKSTLDAEIVALNPKQLLDGTQRYLIPMYQRNYAWGPSEIEQLIIDILDAQQSGNNKTYYLGTLVVFEKPKEATSKQVFEVIDGQQRFTTLTLLIIYLKKYFDSIEDSYMSWYQGENIEFESRPKSSEALNSLLSSDSIDDINNTHGDLYNSSILSGYKSITEIMHNKFNHLNDKADLRAFCEYLFNNVQIARIPVPNETDLNHYFEVMNNRGEQLEKHEIIKARLLSVIENDSSDEKDTLKLLFHEVWEACANMNKYVQYGFSKKIRTAVFSDSWNEFIPENFDGLYSQFKEALQSKEKDSNTEQIYAEDSHNKSTDVPSLYEIITGEVEIPAPPKKINNKNDDTETYYSVIDFPNFLLHVLKIMLNDQGKKIDVTLDDKKLLDLFRDYILKLENSSDRLSQSKCFIYSLLKTKFVFDQYIIKRNTQLDKGHWTLEKLTKNKNSDSVYYKNSFEKEQGKDNDKLVMLQSAFHVSTPTMNYKHWLNAALYYLYQNYSNQDSETDIKASDYLQHLEAIARKFMLRRFLTSSPDDYHHIIYEKSDSGLKLDENISGPNAKRSQIKTHLRYRNIRSVFVFNYLDYLLWLQEGRPKFLFTSRNSIEHFYPQNKRHDNIFINEKDSPDTLLHSFGNLCLISHSLNSRVSNDMPDVKVKYFLDSNQIDSLKLSKMIDYINGKNTNWDKEAIEHHECEMINIMLKGLNLDSQDSNHE